MKAQRRKICQELFNTWVFLNLVNNWRKSGNLFLINITCFAGIWGNYREHWLGRCSVCWRCLTRTDWLTLLLRVQRKWICPALDVIILLLCSARVSGRISPEKRKPAENIKIKEKKWMKVRPISYTTLMKRFQIFLNSRKNKVSFTNPLLTSSFETHCLNILTLMEFLFLYKHK